jgi:signal transduction histidine kinase
MNFSKDEILQRFFRGDQARSGEGSGLGLSIAESFTRVSGGDFDLQVDGDQFKVFMRFPVTDSK